MAPRGNRKINNFISAFNSFNDVVSSCYSKVLQPGYKDKINRFKSCFRALKINVTPKIHAVFFHIIEFCELMDKGLGPWSEQASEAVHSDFKKTWKNYVVRDISHDDYPRRLCSAVVSYNSQHL